MSWTRMFWLAAPLACALAVEPRTPVVVELFTSEGCSSCPRADQLLARLDKLQPVPEAEIIVLSEHVDYWDQQGWPDPFASRLFTSRQQVYSRVFGSDDIYTPQMVVNGQEGFSGGDGERALRDIRRAAGAAHATVAVIRKDQGTLTVQVDRVPAGIQNVEIWLAITEDGLASDVRRGENAGRKLAHTGVVRSLTSIARHDVRKSPANTSDIPLALRDGWKRENLHAVVLVEDRKSRRIVGAARAGL